MSDRSIFLKQMLELKKKRKKDCLQNLGKMSKTNAEH